MPRVRARPAFLERLAVEGVFSRRVEDRVPTVGDLRGERDVLRSFRRDVDRNVGAQRVRDRLQRLAETTATAERQVVALTVEVDGSLAGEDAPNDLDVLA